MSEPEDIQFVDPQVFSHHDDYDDWMLLVRIGNVVKNVVIVSLPTGTVGVYNETLA